jgi:DNA-binding winged helix-turn-helix (wHTH) protein
MILSEGDLYRLSGRASLCLVLLLDRYYDLVDPTLIF